MLIIDMQQTMTRKVKANHWPTIRTAPVPIDVLMRRQCERALYSPTHLCGLSDQSSAKNIVVRVQHPLTRGRSVICHLSQTIRHCIDARGQRCDVSIMKAVSFK